MDDTHPSIKVEYYRRMMKLTGEDRLIMGSRMFDACREIVMASMPQDLSDSELKVRLFLRFYGDVFDEDKRTEIVEYLRKDN